MKIRFTKMQGCGNDYVYIDGGKELIPQEKKADLARFVSNRNFGIGSDGLIFINPVDDPDIDFEMEMYNADGSRSEMCGNGIRCVAKYVYDHHLTDRTILTIVSAGKKKYIDISLGEDGLAKTVKVDMGAPILSAPEVPVRLPGSSNAVSADEDSFARNSDSDGKNMDPAGIPSDAVINESIRVLDKKWNMTCVSMGNPHAVVFLPSGTDLGSFEIEKYGPYFENHEYFPNRTNTEFVTIDDRSNVHMRVWERGTGETLACGTGCCATAVSCILNGLTDNEVTVHVLGGDIKCSWDGTGTSPVIMEGPAVTVFEGELEWEG